ncbi:MAG: hypothetical protein LBE92_05425 [Chryseobacterium sp.]|jgi:hypothetical protein|uniref:hypothetical protein n=1 Tax=Chryseobacterium sp. TaxID=1871047 RepID=UPI002827DD14|nr:hypothetical protein [Chryseobacterium sp.]MDR2235542.1 hypothetical protein [Chryseobacterium sp.]
MSRTRIVKGNITKIVGGDYKRYSSSEIENIGSKIIQNGKDGVIYGMNEEPPESPILHGLEPVLKGEVIFCNGFHSSPIGAVNAALNVTIGIEPKNKNLPDGENTHHIPGDMQTHDTKTPVRPGSLDEDILSSDEVVNNEISPQEKAEFKYFPYPHESKSKTEANETLHKFKGYWNDNSNKKQAVDLYTTYFNAEKRDNYINGSHGMGSPAWERECHGITLGYYWAKKNWKLKTKEEVEKEKEKNPNAESYSPHYRPLTFVGHSEGAAVAVGACIGTMYYAAERGWDEMAINLILLGIHQPVALWSEELYDNNRKQTGNYLTDYNTYKWFKKEVLEVTGDSPRLINELLANLRKVENALTPYGPALAHIFTKDRNKQKYGIDEWTAELLGTDNWNKLKKRAVQFTFANDRADTVMLDGDIPGIANAKGDEDDSTLFGWSKWADIKIPGGLSPNSDFTINITDFGKGYMNTRIKVNNDNPETVNYMKTTYESWANEFCIYHKKFKNSAVRYEKKYKEPWTSGEVYLDKNIILTNTDKAFDYAKTADAHRDMMARYVWMHHVELEAHFAPVGFINRSEIFNLPNESGRDEVNWPRAEGNTIWDRILKTAENKGDLFYRANYGITFFNRSFKDEKNQTNPTILEQYTEVKKNPQQMRKNEQDYVKDAPTKQKLINPQMAYNGEVEKWVKVAKESLHWEDVFNKLKEKMDRQKEQYQREMDETDFWNRNPW